MRIYHILLPLFLAACIAQAQPAAPFGFDTESLMRHRIEGAQEIDVPAEHAESGAWGLYVRVTIDPEGRVTDAQPDRQSGLSGHYGPALAAARHWRFRPFSYRGRPVTAQGSVEIAYRGPALWGNPNAQFPPVDYASLRIELVRSACFGECPDYSVRIDGSGNVLFSTTEPSLEGAAGVHREFSRVPGVVLPGVHRSRIDRAALDALIARFREARFFNLRAEYTGGATDNPTYQLRFTSGGRSWTVSDYIGRTAGMPAAVTALEDEVDRVAGTARWVVGSADSVAALGEEGFDFSSRRAMQVAVMATVQRMTPRAPDRFVIDLIRAGLPLDQSFGTAPETAPLGELLLLGAIRNNRPALFAFLTERGWLARLPRERLSLAFAEGGGGCDPAVARALVAAGADPMARTPRTNDSDSADDAGGTALILATAQYGACREVDIAPLVPALVALGVDINGTDQKGETALFGIENPELQEVLLTAGARADVRDREGNSPAFSSWTDVIVLRLLEAGADPRGHYFDNKTLRQQAHERNMPAVLRWLDAHNLR